MKNIFVTLITILEFKYIFHSGQEWEGESGLPDVGKGKPLFFSTRLHSAFSTKAMLAETVGNHTVVNTASLLGPYTSKTYYNNGTCWTTGVSIDTFLSVL